MDVLIKDLSYDVVKFKEDKEDYKHSNGQGEFPNEILGFEDKFQKLKNDNSNIFIDNENFKVKIVSDLIQKIKPYKITYIKVENSIYYKTIFQGTKLSVLVDGALTSGYGGRGPSDFAHILKDIGFDEETLKEYVYSRRSGANYIEFVLPDNI